MISGQAEGSGLSGTFPPGGFQELSFLVQKQLAWKAGPVAAYEEKDRQIRYYSNQKNPFTSVTFHSDSSGSYLLCIPMHAGVLYSDTRFYVLGEYGGAGQGDCVPQIQKGTDGLSL